MFLDVSVCAASLQSFVTSGVSAFLHHFNERAAYLHGLVLVEVCAKFTMTMGYYWGGKLVLWIMDCDEGEEACEESDKNI